MKYLLFAGTYYDSAGGAYDLIDGSDSVVFLIDKAVLGVNTGINGVTGLPINQWHILEVEKNQIVFRGGFRYMEYADYDKHGFYIENWKVR